MTDLGRPLRVTWLGHGAERTGPPIYLQRILEGLRGHPEIEPSVVLLEGGPLLDDLAALAPTTVVERPELTGVRRASASALGRIGAHRAALATARTAPIAGPPPDVVVVNTAGSIRALPALGAIPRKLITHVHELATGLDYWLDGAARQEILAKSDQLWVVADAVADHLVDEYRVDRSRLRMHRGVLPSGALDAVDPALAAAARAELGLTESDVLVGASGTLDWRKAPDLFVEVAARAIASATSSIHVAWVGGSPTAAWGRALGDLAHSAGIADRVHHLPEQDRPDRWFGAFDLFLLASREDAYPLVCLEAAAAGVPIVTFDSGGAGELIADGGGAVAHYPDVGALADHVRLLADDPALRAEQGRLARSAATRHTIDAALPSLIADLQQVATS